MCLAVPMEIVSVSDDGTAALVNMDGTQCSVDLSLTPGIQEGDFVVVHAGFAIEKLDRDEAEVRSQLFEELAQTQREEIARRNGGE